MLVKIYIKSTVRCFVYTLMVFFSLKKKMMNGFCYNLGPDIRKHVCGVFKSIYRIQTGGGRVLRLV